MGSKSKQLDKILTVERFETYHKGLEYTRESSTFAIILVNEKVIIEPTDYL